MTDQCKLVTVRYSGASRDPESVVRALWGFRLAPE
jgi:hypothetical protein